LHQNEEDENRDDARGCKRMDERRYQRRQGLQSAGIRLLDLNRDRSRRRSAGADKRSGRGGDAIGPIKFAAQIMQHFRSTFERAGTGGSTAQALNLIAQCGFIVRQVLGELIDLRNHQNA